MPVELLVQLFTSVVGIVGECTAVGLRARENIVLVRCISHTVMYVAFFAQGRDLVYTVAKASEIDCVAKQFR